MLTCKFVGSLGSPVSLRISDPLTPERPIHANYSTFIFIWTPDYGTECIVKRQRYIFKRSTGTHDRRGLNGAAFV